MSFSDRVLGFGAFPNRGEDYDIDQSLMFAAADDPALTITYGSDGNRRTFTYSFWAKVTVPGAHVRLFASWNSNDDSGWFDINWDANGRILLQNWTENARTLAMHRDPAAWYHVVVAVDTTQSSGWDRWKVYVNGEQQTLENVLPGETNGYPDLNQETAVNLAASEHSIGSILQSGTHYAHLDGYLAEVHFIDGTALTPSSFGKTDSATNQWIPKEARGLTYGTNGFYLKFVSGAIGTDSSGEGNNWTAVNLADSDVMLDTPTNNFPTLNPLAPLDATLTQGNLHKNSNTGAPATFSFSSGKWYCEVAQLSGSSTSSTFNYYIGVEDSVPGGQRSAWTLNYVSLGMANGGNTPDGFQVTTDTNGTVTQPTGSRPNAVAIIGVAIDVDDGDVEFYINGTLNGKVLGITDWTPPVTVNLANWTGTMGSQPYSINFGQNGTFNGNVTAGGNADGNGYGNFKYSPPTDYLAMCSKNLPTPTIAKPENYFNPVIYTGNATARDITVGFQPDFVWTKSRNSTWSNLVQDSVRGATKELRTNDTIVENTEAQSITAFSSTGYSLGTYNDYNANTYTFVSWSWLAGTAPTADNSAGAGATPTAGSVKIDGSNLGSALAGSIAATRLTANTTSGFSIVTFTMPGSGQATVAHGLGVAPEMIITKDLESTQPWITYAAPVTDTTSKYLRLNTNAAVATYSTIWGAALPTSSVFGVTYDGLAADNDLVAYCFASVEGYSKVGTYVGNNDVDGPFVYTGFRPAFVMAKDVNTTESWNLLDNKRNAYNPVTLPVWADLTSAEGAYGGSGAIDFLSNGFKLRATNGTINGSTNTWVYVAFAESPFKYSNAR